MAMAPVHRVKATNASALQGRPVLDHAKLIWFGSAAVLATGAIIFVSVPAICFFVVITYFTLLFGHSVGMHRMLIHRTFRAPQIIRYALVWLGTMVGMGGPSKIIMVHDLRDWAQRQTACHDYFSHRRNLIRDLSWQLFYRFEFDEPPHVHIEDEITNDRFYAHLNRWWIAHQFAAAIVLLLLGGLPFLCWGTGVRIILSVCGHWFVTHYCHNPGPGRWKVSGAGVQASNLSGPAIGFLTHGECWHNNHHAFPESARIGLDKGQFDPAWAVISWLEQRGLAYDVGQARGDQDRDDLIEIISANRVLGEQHLYSASRSLRHEAKTATTIN